MAAPDSDDSDRITSIEGPNAAESSPVKPAVSAPRPIAPSRKRGGFLSRLLLSSAFLLTTLGLAGYGALTFRDADPRIGLAAGYVDDGLAEARRALDKAQESLTGLTGASPPVVGAKLTTRRSQPLVQTPEPVAGGVENKPASAESTPDAAKESDAHATVAEPPAEMPEPPHKPAEIAQQTPPGAPIPAPPAAEPAKTPEPAAAVSAPTAAPAVRLEAADADGFTDRDLISALEGRIDALGEEVKALREKLDAPKNETRAAPETEAPKPASSAPTALPVVDATATTVVVAFALQRDLEAGRPFAEEIAALSRLSAEPAPAPILIEIAEKGAPTGAQLKESFAPIAKRLKAEEPHAGPHAGSGDLAGHLLEGASKLVKVHPAGHVHSETPDDKNRSDRECARPQ